MSDAIICHQMSSDVIRGHQRSSEVCNQRYAIRGYQRLSEVIRGVPYRHSEQEPPQALPTRSFQIRSFQIRSRQPRARDYPWAKSPCRPQRRSHLHGACKEGGPSAWNQSPKKARAAPAMKENWKSHLPRLPAAEESGMSTVRE